MKYFLSRGHTELFGKEPQEYQPFKIFLHNLQSKTKTNIKYTRSKHSAEIIDIDLEGSEERREEYVGKFIEFIDPTKIVNNVLRDRPLLHTPRIEGLKRSIITYGVVSPILVHTIPKWHQWWKRREYVEGSYIVKEGRHRALVTELIGYVEPIPAFVLIPLHPKDKSQWILPS